MVSSNAKQNVVTGGCWARMGSHVAAGGGLCATMQLEMWLLVAAEQARGQKCGCRWVLAALGIQMWLLVGAAQQL